MFDQQGKTKPGNLLFPLKIGTVCVCEDCWVYIDIRASAA
jgi:hypothetical protein